MATVLPQVPPLRAKSPLAATDRLLIAYPDTRLAVTVTACVPLVLPTAVLA